MTKKRNRSRPALPLQERLNQLAGHARKKAACLPPGRERERLMEVAVANEAAAVIDRWLASPGLRTPEIGRQIGRRFQPDLVVGTTAIT